MKKLISMILSLALVAASFTACSGASETPKADGDSITVAIVQQLDHSSLDEIRTAVEAQLNTLASEKSMTIEIQTYNGQNDNTVLNQICAEVVGNDVDMIIPIATMAATCAVTARDEKDIPIVYAAISDPESAGLTGLNKVTGVSDALNTPFILDMMLSAQPDVQTVGLLYSNSEINSQTPIAQAKEYLDAKGIPYIEKTGTNADEVLAAAASLVGRVEAVFTPTDNAIMNVAAGVAEIFTEAGIAHYTGADSFVTSGAFTTCGVNYTELGTQVADMAFDLLMGGETPEFMVSDGGIITVNTDTAKAIGLDYSSFQTMANTVVEVTTAE